MWSEILGSCLGTYLGDSVPNMLLSSPVVRAYSGRVPKTIQLFSHWYTFPWRIILQWANPSCLWLGSFQHGLWSDIWHFFLAGSQGDWVFLCVFLLSFLTISSQKKKKKIRILLVEMHLQKLWGKFCGYRGKRGQGDWGKGGIEPLKLSTEFRIPWARKVLIFKSCLNSEFPLWLSRKESN